MLALRCLHLAECLRCPDVVVLTVIVLAFPGPIWPAVDLQSSLHGTYPDTEFIVEKRKSAPVIVSCL